MALSALITWGMFGGEGYLQAPIRLHDNDKKLRGGVVVEIFLVPKIADRTLVFSASINVEVGRSLMHVS